MSADQHAEARYRESVELLSQVPVALDLAHTRLLFGEWLRRRRRRVEARAHLRAAYQRFDSCGAAPFAGRARAEIASRLFITVSTVEFHLNKVFRKLGISSRRQIASRLERAEEPPQFSARSGTDVAHLRRSASDP